MHGEMLLGRGFAAGGHLAAMGRLLQSGSNLDPSPERCRSLLVPEDSGVDVENGGKRTIPKSRNGMLGEDMDDAAPLESGLSMSDMQMGSFSTLKAAKRAEVGGTGPKVGRPRKLSVYNPREMSDGNPGEDCLVVGPSATVSHSEGLSASGKRRKQHLPFTVDDLDIMCGVPSPRSGAPCRQPLTCKSHSISSKRAVTGRRKPFDALLQDFKDNNSRKSQQDIPRPLATKVYCSGHSQRMRAVITSLYRESISGRSSLPQNEQTLALDANPQQQQQQHTLMSLNKVRTTEGGDKVEVVLYAAAHLPAFTARRLSGYSLQRNQQAAHSGPIHVARSTLPFENPDFTGV
ncbi:SCA7 domain-containing protein SELMODRAFT_431321 isoform X2 [Selaginella moellendorffii]|uniref:SCA7 domain-containing protein SELMODRAFT_431321 isoform X2 n=1 Tax=Selaginella moellendorffii TaxID=88036 RepID=UPI000D1C6AA7|nr:SCA7 domain-containing protein SELMODRAFT_431321 isoform X2 [Selaginella moellendorffii]|eukprot:XP_024526294.1 SCA7 domain-containing protein SELMODRAFT_431321 isoform X2 [Selaginella moellendorffii]